MIAAGVQLANELEDAASELEGAPPALLAATQKLVELLRAHTAPAAEAPAAPAAEVSPAAPTAEAVSWTESRDASDEVTPSEGGTLEITQEGSVVTVRDFGALRPSARVVLRRGDDVTSVVHVMAPPPASSSADGAQTYQDWGVESGAAGVYEWM